MCNVLDLHDVLPHDLDILKTCGVQPAGEHIAHWTAMKRIKLEHLSLSLEVEIKFLRPLCNVQTAVASMPFPEGLARTLCIRRLLHLTRAETAVVLNPLADRANIFRIRIKHHFRLILAHLLITSFASITSFKPIASYLSAI